MKIQLDHYYFMRDRMKLFAHLIPQMRADIIAEGKSKDVEKRLRWDLCYRVDLNPWICEVIYPYANDDHLDTALRNIMRDIERGAAE